MTGLRRPRLFVWSATPLRPTHLASSSSADACVSPRSPPFSSRRQPPTAPFCPRHRTRARPTVGKHTIIHEVVGVRLGKRVLGTSSSARRPGPSPREGSRRVMSRARYVRLRHREPSLVRCERTQQPVAARPRLCIVRICRKCSILTPEILLSSSCLKSRLICLVLRRRNYFGTRDKEISTLFSVPVSSPKTVRD